MEVEKRNKKEQGDKKKSKTEVHDERYESDCLGSYYVLAGN